MLAEARAAGAEAPAEPRQKELAYLEGNRDRMDYLRYRQRGWFIGSGAVEAGCKRVVGQRLKQSGMFGPKLAQRRSSASVALCFHRADGIICGASPYRTQSNPIR